MQESREFDHAVRFPVFCFIGNCFSLDNLHNVSLVIFCEYSQNFKKIIKITDNIITIMLK